MARRLVLNGLVTCGVTLNRKGSKGVFRAPAATVTPMPYETHDGEP